MSNITVIYHGDCPDGFGAALSAYLEFGQTATYHPALYGSEPPDVRGKDVYILDFSYDLEVMKQIDAQAASLNMLDHHLTAKNKLHGFSCSCGKVVFDLKKSGAMLAWEHFNPEVPAPALVRHIQDRDLWTWELPESGAFLTALDAVGHDFEKWKQVLEMDEEQHRAFVAKGQIMRDQFLSICQDIASRAIEIEFCGHKTLAVNATGLFTSEVGNILAKKAGTMSLVWSVPDKDNVKVGLRSVNEFNVEELARKFAGGGHPQAAAFRMPLQGLQSLLDGTLSPAVPQVI